MVEITNSNKVDWKLLPTIHQGIYWCINCKGKGWLLNKFDKQIPCIACGGRGILKECINSSNGCDYVMQMDENKCIHCILNAVHDSSTDDDFKDEKW